MKKISIAYKKILSFEVTPQIYMELTFNHKEDHSAQTIVFTFFINHQWSYITALKYMPICGSQSELRINHKRVFEKGGREIYSLSTKGIKYIRHESFHIDLVSFNFLFNEGPFYI